MNTIIAAVLISFVVGIAYGAPADNETKIKAPIIQLIQPQDNNTIENIEVAEDSNDRILKGVQAKKNEFPFIVSLQMQHPKAPLGVMHKFCGGSIISDSLILTAAHCFSDDMSTIYVKAGSVNAFDPKGQTRTVARIIKHPCYNQQNMYGIPNMHDVAVLILAEPLQLSQSVQPILLATDALDVERGAKGQVLGWGATHGSDHSQSSVELLYKDIDVISPQECARYSNILKVHSNVVCVSNGDNSDAGPCVGDSGGPFIQKVNGKPVLAGLTSYGSPICGKIPTIYTRVSKYLDFINDIVNNRQISPFCA